MTDRLKGVVVTFDQDIRTDDAEFILNAIQAIKHVVSVKPMVADLTDLTARERIRYELRDKLLEAFDKILEK